MLNRTADKLRRILELLRGTIKGDMSARNLNATGKTAESIRVGVLGTDSFIRGTLYANENWETTGSGTPPGSGVTTGEIADWAEAKGLSELRGAAKPIADTINKYGSRDFRRNSPNVFLDAIQRFNEQGEFNVIREVNRDAFEIIIPSFRKLGRA